MVTQVNVTFCINFVTLQYFTSLSVVIKLEKDDIGLPRLTKGGLADIYVLEQIHFHWGSEHTINNER